MNYFLGRMNNYLKKRNTVKLIYRFKRPHNRLRNHHDQGDPEHHLHL